MIKTTGIITNVLSIEVDKQINGTEKCRNWLVIMDIFGWKAMLDPALV